MPELARIADNHRPARALQGGQRARVEPGRPAKVRPVRHRGDHHGPAEDCEGGAAGDDTRTWTPPERDGVSTYFMSINRNKRSVVMDFRDPDDVGLVHELFRRADVVLENFQTIDQMLSYLRTS